MFAVFGPRRVRTVVLAFCALSLVVAGLASSSGSAVASVGSDQTSIAQLEQQIAAQGAQAQTLVSRYNEVQAHLNSLDAQIAHNRILVAADQRVENTAASAMRSAAVTAYVSGTGMDSPALAMFSGSWNVSRMLEQNKYLGTVNTKLDSELTALHLDQVRTRDAQSGLLSEQAQAKKALDQLTAAHDAATAAIAADEAKLSQFKGDLRSLLGRCLRAAPRRAGGGRARACCSTVAGLRASRTATGAHDHTATLVAHIARAVAVAVTDVERL